MESISFCINTARNEINHVKLLFKSLQQNLSTTEHEIVVFIDSDNQGTFDWLMTQKDIFPNLRILKNELPICYGYARNINEMFQFATNEIVSYLQSDMVVCKDYDLEVLKHLEPNMVLCSTRIEPPLHGNSREKITHDFGLDPVVFDLEAFTAYADQQKLNQLTEYFFAPFTMYKDVWNGIGGHDTVFRRSREDSDVLARLVLNGTKIKQTWLALVYHFTCTSSRGPEWFNKQNHQAQERAQLQQTADAIEIARYITKWGGFSHSLHTTPYYNIAAHVTGMDVNLANFNTIQSYFHRVYVDDSHIVPLMQELFDRNHEPANKLLNISSESWKTYGYMYNQLRAADRIIPFDERQDEDDILVKFDMKDITPQLFSEFISNIQQIIASIDEIGNYEYGPFAIAVYQKIDRVSDKIVITNPQVKPEHKYTIH
jgi:GT2 family glycosyltransferase